jgi:hypothetical protein
VVHVNTKTTVLDIINVFFIDYESGGYKFPHSDPFGRILSGVPLQSSGFYEEAGVFLFMNMVTKSQALMFRSSAS